MSDQTKQRREFARWVMALGLYNARPVGAREELLLSILQSILPAATARETRLALDYLADRKLIDLNKRPDGRWFAYLSRYGVDVIEDTVPCEPGIARWRNTPEWASAPKSAGCRTRCAPSSSASR